MRIAIRILQKRNPLFVDENFDTRTTAEVISLVMRGRIPGLTLVKSPRSLYVRTKANSSREDNIAVRSITINRLARPFDAPALLTAESLSRMIRSARKSSRQSARPGAIAWKHLKSQKDLEKFLTKYQKTIRAAARQFSIDAALLRAILIDEYLRLDIQDALTDWIATMGFNKSVGMAQVRIETARQIIIDGVYNPDPRNKLLSSKWIRIIDGFHVYRYLKQEKFSIFFAAAYIHFQSGIALKKKIDIIKHPEYLAASYSSGKMPPTHPAIAARGRQIMDEFYPLARSVLR